MKKFIIGKTDKLCPDCRSPLTIIYYGESGDIFKDVPPVPSFTFCSKCSGHPEEFIKKVRGILLLGNKQT